MEETTTYQQILTVKDLLVEFFLNLDGSNADSLIEHYEQKIIEAAKRES